MDSDRFATLSARLWYEFGGHPETGHVDIASGGEDILTDVHPAVAARIIEDHNKYLTDDELHKS